MTKYTLIKVTDFTYFDALKQFEMQQDSLVQDQVFTLRLVKLKNDDDLYAVLSWSGVKPVIADQEYTQQEMIDYLNENEDTEPIYLIDTDNDTITSNENINF